MKVVSNSSPLIFLSAIGMLNLLKAEFGEILVPEAVYDEVTSNELKDKRSEACRLDKGADCQKY